MNIYQYVDATYKNRSMEMSVKVLFYVVLFVSVSIRRRYVVLTRRVLVKKKKKKIPRLDISYNLAVAITNHIQL